MWARFALGSLELLQASLVLPGASLQLGSLELLQASLVLPGASLQLGSLELLQASLLPGASPGCAVWLPAALFWPPATLV